jgi:outer membrane protein assembly factor BamD (BamD/ComL family)
MALQRSAAGARPTAGRRARALLACALLCAQLAAGCSAEQVYNAAAGWRRNECYQLGADAAQRERCLKEADRPYDAYRAAQPAP